MSNKILLILIIIILGIAAVMYSGGDIHFGGIKPIPQTIEFGMPLPNAQTYYRKADKTETQIVYYLEGIKIEEPNFVGDYDVELYLKDGRVVKTTLTIQDTIAPSFKVQPLRIKQGDSYSPAMFVVPDSAFDLSGYIEFSFTEDRFGEYTEKGTYPDIGIKGVDKYKNAAILYTSLVIY